MSDDRAKVNSLRRLLKEEMLRGRKAILVGGGWTDMSAADTELENDGSVILLDNSSFCGGNSTVATGRIVGANTVLVAGVMV